MSRCHGTSFVQVSILPPFTTIRHFWTSRDTGRKLLQVEKPYTSWEDVRYSARRYWEIYRKVVDVETIDRVGVRFINQFRLRHDQKLADYLTVLPQVPETVAPEEVADTLSRLTIRDDKMGISARVFYVCKPDETGVTVIIDTDAAKLGRIDAEDIWASLEQLREVKNRIFFGSITETAAQEFDE